MPNSKNRARGTSNSPTVNSLYAYLSQVSKIRKQWAVSPHQELWFRAEDEKHVQTWLQPGLYRPRRDGKRKSVSFLLLLENELHNEFSRCASQLAELKLNGEEDWKHYFLMQHHGVPTRLLDWTDGALIALHFAVRNKPAPATSGAVVHILDPWWLLDVLEDHEDRNDCKKRWKKFHEESPYDTDVNEWEELYLPRDSDDRNNPLLAMPKAPVLWDSPHISRRVAAQRSRFMIFGSDPLWLADLAKDKDSRLVTVHISANRIESIKQELRDSGISESVVYPDLDGLGRELKQTWESRR
jgi:hypothetical protein